MYTFIFPVRILIREVDGNGNIQDFSQKATKKLAAFPIKILSISVFSLQYFLYNSNDLLTVTKNGSNIPIHDESGRVKNEFKLGWHESQINRLSHCTPPRPRRPKLECLIYLAQGRSCSSAKMR